MDSKDNGFNIKVVNTSVIILLNEYNEFLLNKKDLRYKWFPGMWCLFGGGIEKGESPEATIKREVYEELGIKLDNVSLFDSRPYQDKPVGNDIRKGKVWTYISHINEKVENLRIKEGAGFAYFSHSELDNIVVVDYNLEIIRDYFKSNH